LPALILARLRAHLLLPAAAALTVLLTASVLGALTAFGAATGDSGLRHRLEGRAAADAVIDAHATVTAGERAGVDAAVTAALRRAFDGLPTEVVSATRSGSYALPRTGGGPPVRGGNPDLTVFASLDRDRVRMTDGGWPSGAGRPGPDGTLRVPVAVPALAAERLGLEPGDVLRVASRLDGPPPVRAEITGVWVPKDRTDPYRHLRLRLRALGPEPVGATVSMIVEDGAESTVTREYTTIDRAGRLQLPAEFTEPLAIRDRVLLELRPGHIEMRPDTPPG
jgi:bifunctional DNA-binding transcriptional regulator/antitoxin component of YhaV-PrlF toxin-antitoxin module